MEKLRFKHHKYMQNGHCVQVNLSDIIWIFLKYELRGFVTVAFLHFSYDIDARSVISQSNSYSE